MNLRLARFAAAVAGIALASCKHTKPNMLDSMATKWQYGTRGDTCSIHGRNNQPEQPDYTFCKWAAHYDETLVGDRVDGALIYLQLRRTVEDSEAAFALTDSLRTALNKRGPRVRECARQEFEKASTGGFRWANDSTVIELHWVNQYYKQVIVSVTGVRKPSLIQGLGCPG